mmetsp:Transcript_52409/g.170104  ORF Transcript_52409/g.170104 Transcript_52409/m.170104 type:complete len:250 (+) Transcript_52409:53-802(+)
MDVCAGTTHGATRNATPRHAPLSDPALTPRWAARAARKGRARRQRARRAQARHRGQGAASRKTARAPTTPAPRPTTAARRAPRTKPPWPAAAPRRPLGRRSRQRRRRRGCSGGEPASEGGSDPTAEDRGDPKPRGRQSHAKPTTCRCSVRHVGRRSRRHRLPAGTACPWRPAPLADRRTAGRRVQREAHPDGAPPPPPWKASGSLPKPRSREALLPRGSALHPSLPTPSTNQHHRAEPAARWTPDHRGR